MLTSSRKWKRTPTAHALWWGVCAGTAYTLGLSPNLIRLLTMLFFMWSGGAMIFINAGLAFTLSTWEILPDDFDTIIKGR